MTQIKTIDVSDTETTESFDPNVNRIILENTGSVPCHFQLNGAATTDHFRLDPSDKMEIGLIDISEVSAITDSDTTKLQVIGIEEW